MIPCALITSCSGLKPDEVVKSILRVNELPASTSVVENVVSYPWHVETKYYTADVSLCITDNRTIGSEEFAKAVQAVVITFDSTQMSSFDEVKMWLPYLKEIESPVQVLVCDRSLDEDVISRRSLVGWCLDNGFELVELHPIESDDGSDEDDFKESFGIERIVEALSCHSWPNMVMKDKPSFRSPYFEKLMSDEAVSNRTQNSSNFAHQNHTDSGKPEAEDTKPKSDPKEASANSSSDNLAAATVPTSTQDGTPKSSTSDTRLSSQQIIDTMISDLSGEHDVDEEGEESFEKLFERLQIMKATAANLPSDQRKEYAKQVTIQFWKAIGGNPDEIDGLSDSDAES